jgi:hypothetical protein
MSEKRSFCQPWRCSEKPPGWLEHDLDDDLDALADRLERCLDDG